MKKKLKMIGFGLLGLFLLIQLVPVSRTNPPVASDVNAPPEVKRILVAS